MPECAHNTVSSFIADAEIAWDEGVIYNSPFFSKNAGDSEIEVKVCVCLFVP
ncbi:hypothetical protein KIN20_032506 [Parelaphostrongylus tenuis]|uniref:Uncharacterized protein n=1 Tax=Parelaphostrongylus tenuis TaxID=148309 RepID=A0AAD5WI31_PARTN|nr:hypothetical protein KIN20_032506 [Parelaphostrongylus tenuis]